MKYDKLLAFDLADPIKMLDQCINKAMNCDNCLVCDCLPWNSEECISALTEHIKERFEKMDLFELMK